MHIFASEMAKRFMKNYNHMRNLHIIMPMAGEGSRFRNAGWATPKPLIELKGKPLFVRAIESVRVDGGADEIFFHSA